MRLSTPPVYRYRVHDKNFEIMMSLCRCRHRNRHHYAVKTSFHLVRLFLDGQVAANGALGCLVTDEYRLVGRRGLGA